MSELLHLLKATDRPSNAALVVVTLLSFVSSIARDRRGASAAAESQHDGFVIYRLALGALLLELLQTGYLLP